MFDASDKTSEEVDAEKDLEAMARDLGLAVAVARHRLAVDAELDRVSAEIAKELGGREIYFELDRDLEKLVFTVSSKTDAEIVARHGQIARQIDPQEVEGLRAAKLELDHAVDLLAQSGRPSGLSSWNIDWKQRALRIKLYVGTPEARQAADAMRSQVRALGVPVEIEETRVQVSPGSANSTVPASPH